MARYAMAIDTTRCFGCNSCSMRCKVEHNLPVDVMYSRARTLDGDLHGRPSGTYPNVSVAFYTHSCQHCESPACMEACPTGATQKRDDGIVWVDNSVCIGCDSCIAACPYGDMRAHITDPKYYLDYALGAYNASEHVDGTVEKCTFCMERVDQGQSPACVEICRSGARIFGDLDDVDSEISRILKERESTQLEADIETGSNVFLLK